MKKIISISFALFFYCQLAHALPPQDRKINKGTVFNYMVKEGLVTYKVKVTVSEWDEDLNVKLQWQALGAKTLKAETVQPYLSLLYASQLKIQMTAGNETFSNDISRWLVGYDAFDFLYNMDMDLDLKIDDKNMRFTESGNDIKKDILYNNVKTSMNYVQGKTVSSTAPVIIGLIEYADKVILLDNYSNGNFSLQLVSIQNPVAKQVAKINKLAEDMTQDLLKAMGPKRPVPLKKMEPAKFAKVKKDYPVLASIENYDGTNGGKVKKPITETYEFRYNSSSPNPPSLVDCLTADMQILYNQKAKYGIAATEGLGSKSLPSATAKKILEVYLNYEYNNIPGYRPWTHWRFVKGLTESQRDQLATELEGYISQYGFTE